MLNEIKLNLAGMNLMWLPFKILSDSPDPFKMAVVTKKIIFFNCPLLHYYKSK